MYATFYIFFLILIIIVSLILSSSKKEHFLSNTIELNNLTLKPLRFKSYSSISNEFLKALSSYISIIEDTKTPEFQIIPKSLAMYDYLNGAKSLRLVSNIYETYFTMITNKDSQVYTYDDILMKPGLTIYYLEPEMSRLMQLLFPKLKSKYIDRLPNKLPPGDIYCYWETEYSIKLQSLAKNNKFLIIQMPKTDEVYNMIQISYPNLVPDKYDISLQNSINTERVIYTLRDTISIFTVDSVEDYRVYSLIKTIFNHIINIRTNVKSEQAKYILEYLRPENLIEIAIVPYHRGVEKYFRELEIYTNKPEAICVNTISTIPCQPKKLFDNRFRMILYGSNG